MLCSMALPSKLCAALNSQSNVGSMCYCKPCRSLGLLALVGDVYFIFVTFPGGILGQVWYLIVSFPDLCRLSYFVSFGGNSIRTVTMVQVPKETAVSTQGQHYVQ